MLKLTSSLSKTSGPSSISGRTLNSSRIKIQTDNRREFSNGLDYQKMADSRLCKELSKKALDWGSKTFTLATSPFLFSYGFTSALRRKPNVNFSKLSDRWSFLKRLESASEASGVNGRKESMELLSSFKEGSVADTMLGPVELLYNLLGEAGAAEIAKHYKEADILKLLEEEATYDRILAMAKGETFNHWQAGTEEEKKARFYGSLMPWQGRYLVLAGSYQGLKAKKAYNAMWGKKE